MNTGILTIALTKFTAMEIEFMVTTAKIEFVPCVVETEKLK